ncbi:hypothetical protein J3F84DRAFT_373173 [Trichoderma pleuroticola]
MPGGGGAIEAVHCMLVVSCWVRFLYLMRCARLACAFPMLRGTKEHPFSASTLLPCVSCSWTAADICTSFPLTPRRPVHVLYMYVPRSHGPLDSINQSCVRNSM